jgi:hypothetical protein
MAKAQTKKDEAAPRKAGPSDTAEDDLRRCHRVEAKGLLPLSSVSTNPEADRLAGRPTAFELRQLEPIALVSADPTVFVVRADSPYKTLKDLVENANKRPGGIAYASSGNYGTYHVATEMFAHSAGIKMHHIPYGGVIKPWAVSQLFVIPTCVAAVRDRCQWLLLLIAVHRQGAAACRWCRAMPPARPLAVMSWPAKLAASPQPGSPPARRACDFAPSVDPNQRLCNSLTRFAIHHRSGQCNPPATGSHPSRAPGAAVTPHRWRYQFPNRRTLNTAVQFN